MSAHLARISEYDAEAQKDAWLSGKPVPTVEDLRKPREFTPEQVAAQNSRALCARCGHEERYHTIPDGGEPRECFPPEETDWDLRTGEEVVINPSGCCACEDFALEKVRAISAGRR